MNMGSRRRLLSDEPFFCGPQRLSLDYTGPCGTWGIAPYGWAESKDTSGRGWKVQERCRRTSSSSRHWRRSSAKKNLMSVSRTGSKKDGEAFILKNPFSESHFLKQFNRSAWSDFRELRLSLAPETILIVHIRPGEPH